MTALEICKYFNIWCNGDYLIKTTILPTGFFFFEPGTSFFNCGGSVRSFNAQNKTCDEFIRYVAKRNLENYSVSTIRHVSRFVDYDDIRVDKVNKVVTFG